MYDVIVIGARVAGSPAAMLLARKGYKVLVVDRATFPSDTLSTHQIQIFGSVRLKRWGLLDAVRATNCPPAHQLNFDIGPFALQGAYPALETSIVAFNSFGLSKRGLKYSFLMRSVAFSS